MSEDHDMQDDVPAARGSSRDNFDIGNEIVHQTSKATCPMCGNDHWIGLPSPRLDDHRYDTGVALPIIETDSYPYRDYQRRFSVSSNSKLAGSIPVMAFVCGNCGFVRQHVLFPKELRIQRQQDGQFVTQYRSNSEDLPGPDKDQQGE